MNLKSLVDEQGFSWQTVTSWVCCHSLSLGFGDNENRDKALMRLLLAQENPFLSLSLSLSLSLNPSLPFVVATFTPWWSGKHLQYIAKASSACQNPLWKGSCDITCFQTLKHYHTMKESTRYTHVEIILSKKTPLSFSVRWKDIQSELCGNGRRKTNAPIVHKNDMFILSPWLEVVLNYWPCLLRQLLWVGTKFKDILLA